MSLTNIQFFDDEVQTNFLKDVFHLILCTLPFWSKRLMKLCRSPSMKTHSVSLCLLQIQLNLQILYCLAKVPLTYQFCPLTKSFNCTAWQRCPWQYYSDLVVFQLAASIRMCLSVCFATPLRSNCLPQDLGSYWQNSAWSLFDIVKLIVKAFACSILDAAAYHLLVCKT